MLKSRDLKRWKIFYKFVYKLLNQYESVVNYYLHRENVTYFEFFLW